MANLVPSAVTVLETWTEGDTHGKRLNCFYVKLVCTGQGDNVNLIPANVVMPGFGTIVESTSFYLNSSQSILSATPSVDRTYLLIGTAELGVTDTVYGVVKGY